MNKAVKLLLVLGLITNCAFAQSKPEPLTRTISVSAVVDTLVVPDLATFRVSIYFSNRVAAVAKDSTVRQARVVTDVLKRSGIKSEHIQTQGLRSSRSVNRRGQAIYYSFSESFAVKSTNTDSLERIVDALAEMGIPISELEWEVSKGDKYRLSLSTRALDEAESQARTLAEHKQLKLGRLISVSDASSKHLSSGEQTVSGRAAGIRIRGLAGIPGGSSSVDLRSVDLNPGQVKLSYVIYVVFEIKEL